MLYEVITLELSLELFEKLLCDPLIRGWGEFGLVVQAYSKRALLLLWLGLGVLVWNSSFDLWMSGAAREYQLQRNNFV